jgi:hypothetical protein
VLLELLAKEDRRLADGWLSAHRSRRDSRRAQRRAGDSHAAPAGRVDRCGARDSESGRDHHQGINMSCQDHLYRGMHPRDVSRRWFFKECGVGVGAAALMHLLAEAGVRGRRSAGPEGSAVRAQGEARHLPLHGRRAEPPGALRLQAAARQIRRHAAAAGTAERLSRRLHQSQFEAARPEVSSSTGTARPTRNYRSCCRSSARSWTMSPS